VRQFIFQTGIAALYAIILCTKPAAAAPMNLAEALRYALENAPSMQQARSTIEVREAQVDRARARYLPSLDLTTTQGLMRSGVQQFTVVGAGTGGGGGNTGGGTLQPLARSSSPWFSQLGLSLTETVYDNGQSLMQHDISEANLEIARLNFLETRDTTLLEVSRAYYALSQADILLNTNQQQAQLTAKQLSKLESLYKQGLKTKREYFRLKSQAQRAAIEVGNAQVAKANATIELRRVMGVPPGTSDVTFVTLTAEDLQREEPGLPIKVPTVEASYLAKIAALEAEVATVNIDLARRRNLPVVTVSSTLNYQVPSYLAFAPAEAKANQWNWNVLLGVNYNIWDAGSRRRDIDLSASQLTIQNRDNRDKLYVRATGIAKLMETLRNLKNNLQLNRELMRLEQVNFATLEEDYRQGKVAYLDLVTGLSDLLSARVSYYTNYINLLTAIAQYRYYEATIYETAATA